MAECWRDRREPGEARRANRELEQCKGNTSLHICILQAAVCQRRLGRETLFSGMQRTCKSVFIVIQIVRGLSGHMAQLTCKHKELSCDSHDLSKSQVW